MGNRRSIQQSNEPLINNPTSNQENTDLSIRTIKLCSHVLSNTFKTTLIESSISITFSYDSNCDGSISVYFLAAERLSEKGLTECYYIDTVRFPSPIIKYFGANLDQVFDEEIIFDLNKYSFSELTFADEKTYPLVIEIRDNETPNSIERTYVKFKYLGGNWETDVIAQRLTIGNEVFDVNEFYGAEEETKECVVCLTNHRETLLLPCYHMCLCGGCSNIMRSQYDFKCPMCRTVVKSLVNINHDA